MVPFNQVTEPDLIICIRCAAYLSKVLCMDGLCMDGWMDQFERMNQRVRAFGNENESKSEGIWE